MAVFMLTHNSRQKLRNYRFQTSQDTVEETSVSWRDADFRVDAATDLTCRVCGGSACTPIMEQMEDCDILSAIRLITDIDIDINDSLPKYICINCLEDLKAAFRFRKKCIESDKRFRKLFQPNGRFELLKGSYPYSKHDFQMILHKMRLKRKKLKERLERKKNNVRRKKKKAIRKKVKCRNSYQCRPCGLGFSSKEKRSQHQSQTNCQKHPCDLCGHLVRNINQHMRQTHQKGDQHKCPTCGKEFPILARLKSHMLVHSDAYRFHCAHCSYRSKHKYYLVMHMRTHTGEKPYSCALCPATFVNPSNYNKHKLTHVPKKFQCKVCEKWFRSGTILSEHHRAAHMNLKHRCALCDRVFSYRSDLRKHQIHQHNRQRSLRAGREPSYVRAERKCVVLATEHLTHAAAEHHTNTATEHHTHAATGHHAHAAAATESTTDEKVTTNVGHMMYIVKEENELYKAL